jgi:hypothetical protein
MFQNQNKNSKQMEKSQSVPILVSCMKREYRLWRETAIGVRSCQTVFSVP